MEMEGVVRLRTGRSWLVAALIALAVVFVVWFVLTVPGCGSGSSGIGLG